MWVADTVSFFLIRLLRGRYAGDAVRAASQKPVRLFVFERLIPKWAAGQTWGDTILVTAGYEKDDSLIRHELVHVEQWHRYGNFFPLLYAWQWLAAATQHGWSNAYWYNIFEVQARNAE
jgi:hypothetical protein